MTSFVVLVAVVMSFIVVIKNIIKVMFAVVIKDCFMKEAMIKIYIGSFKFNLN